MMLNPARISDINRTTVPQITRTVADSQSDDNKANYASARPIVEIATYAETDVYECYFRGAESHIVMRRTRDDWINITQVFKVAKFSKNHRTKVLERESSNLRHEKVQGGYGRFQGTWIPLVDAKRLIAEYNINDPVVQTIINFNLDPSNPPRRRMKNSILRKASPGKKISSPSSYNKTPKRKNNQPQASQSNLQKKVKKSTSLQANPSPLHNVAFQTPRQSNITNSSNTTAYRNTNSSTLDDPSSISVNPTMSRLNSADNIKPHTNGYSASQKPLQFFPVPTNVSNEGPTRPPNNVIKYGNNTMNFFKINKKPKVSNFITFVPENSTSKTITSQIDTQSSNNEKTSINIQRHYASGNEFIENNSQEKIELSTNKMLNSKLQPSSIEDINNVKTKNAPTNSTFSLTNNYSDNDRNLNIGNQLKIQRMNKDEYRELILKVLAYEPKPDESYTLPNELYHPPEGFNIDAEIDQQSHTALHWASAMANIPLIKALLYLNANALYCNIKGFNCVTKSLFYNNNYTNNTFGELIYILRICLVTPDQNRRLPFHYLVELSANKSKDDTVITSYIETMLRALAEENYSTLQMCLDFQDTMGNTPLHLAALNLNLDLFNKLCLLGASIDIPNAEGHSAVEILSRFNMIVPPTSQMGIKPNLDTDNKLLVNPKIKLEQEKNLRQTIKSEELPQETQMTTLLETPILYKNQSPRTFLQSNEKNNTSLGQIMEDLSSIDAIVNSSVIKYAKSSPAPLQSPSTMKQSIKDATRTNKDHSTALEEKIAPLFPEKSTNSPTFSKGNKLNRVVNQLVSKIDMEINSNEHEIKILRSNLVDVQKTANSVTRQKNNIFKSLKIKDTIELEKSKINLLEDVKEKKTKLRKQLEKSQALILAQAAEEEQNLENCIIEAGDIDVRIKDSLKFAILQLKRRSMLQRLVEVKSRGNSAIKLRKYRALIGSTFSDIDTKLDEIEKDLKSAV
ncbi:hypothetical protein KAFR_0L01860 [Kazachstania africana CBS 2517]|uniref:HTH APSES-type domain-containing protein n=1 Tax=Kazachstania africana (strain ATCC 22294 / BCRC 22015 / CBS 2517 / CECT 1963 / NBRC 1671 / NRRL Y-8276) TaxID=1071382 RepID=H2B2E6_KAZAF|nr:hypothetical protein KAFR_0L01860 [Kazachstania africana CBS 2517]CCF60796.1 hypothetical protein KAFR_0L01860 [Kazachstania africana CBS 2517]